jgi:hypothetical protein
MLTGLPGLPGGPVAEHIFRFSVKAVINQEESFVDHQTA